MLSVRTAGASNRRLTESEEFQAIEESARRQASEGQSSVTTRSGRVLPPPIVLEPRNSTPVRLTPILLPPDPFVTANPAYQDNSPEDPPLDESNESFHEALNNSLVRRLSFNTSEDSEEYLDDTFINHQSDNKQDETLGVPGQNDGNLPEQDEDVDHLFEPHDQDAQIVVVPMNNPQQAPAGQQQPPAGQGPDPMAQIQNLLQRNLLAAQQASERCQTLYNQRPVTLASMDGLPQFSGDGDSNWTDWSRQFNRIAVLSAADTMERKVALLSTRLRGAALAFFHELDHQNPPLANWQAWIDAFAGRFPDNQHIEIKTEQLVARTQRIGEPVLQFATDIRRLARRAFPNWNGRQQNDFVKNHFISHLNPSIRQWVQNAEPETFEDAVVEAEKQEIRDQQSNNSYVVLPGNVAVINASSLTNLPSSSVNTLANQFEGLSMDAHIQINRITLIKLNQVRILIRSRLIQINRITLNETGRNCISLIRRTIEDVLEDEDDHSSDRWAQGIETFIPTIARWIDPLTIGVTCSYCGIANHHYLACRRREWDANRRNSQATNDDRPTQNFGQNQTSSNRGNYQNNTGTARGGYPRTNSRAVRLITMNEHAEDDGRYVNFEFEENSQGNPTTGTEGHGYDPFNCDDPTLAQYYEGAIQIPSMNVRMVRSTRTTAGSAT